MFKKINIQFLISYFGLIPYAMVFLDKYYFLKIKEEILFNFITYYSLIIIVFIGSINWNLKNNPPSSLEMRKYAEENYSWEKYSRLIYKHLN